MQKKYSVGFTTGVFDLFHVGHLNLLEKCKAMCDRLIVAVCDDEYVRDIKHKEPVIPQDDRMRIIGALKCVDEVVLINTAETEDKMLCLPKFHFDVLFAGDNWKGSERFQRTEKQFADLGIAIVYFPYTKGVSTSQIREKCRSGRKRQNHNRFRYECFVMCIINNEQQQSFLCRCLFISYRTMG